MNIKKSGKEKEDKKLSEIISKAKECFESPEFKKSPRVLENAYNNPSGERLLRRMTI